MYILNDVYPVENTTKLIGVFHLKLGVELFCFFYLFIFVLKVFREKYSGKILFLDVIYQTMTNTYYTRVISTFPT